MGRKKKRSKRIKGLFLTSTKHSARWSAAPSKVKKKDDGEDFRDNYLDSLSHKPER